MTRPRDVFFRDRDEAASPVAASGRAPGHGVSPGVGSSFRPTSGQIPDHTAYGPVGTTSQTRHTTGLDPTSSAPGAAEVPDDRRLGEPQTATPETDREDGTDDIQPVPGATFALLPLEEIRPNPRQPREIFDEDELAELVHSIKEIGVLQPVVVRPIPDAQPGSGEAAYELVMGERRWRASREAEQPNIPAIIRSTGDDAMLRDALLENLHRTQLNPLEEAAAYQQLLEDFGCTHDELAGRIGRSRPQISNVIRLLKLPPLVQRRVAAGVLSAGHARALLALPDAGAMERLAQRIVAEGLSVRSVEEIVALGGEPERPSRRSTATDKRMPELDDLAAFLADRWDTRVSIAMGRRKGRLTVEFASVEDLNRILEAIGERPAEGGHDLNSLAG